MTILNLTSTYFPSAEEPIAEEKRVFQEFFENGHIEDIALLIKTYDPVIVIVEQYQEELQDILDLDVVLEHEYEHA